MALDLMVDTMHPLFGRGCIQGCNPATTGYSLPKGNAGGDISYHSSDVPSSAPLFLYFLISFLKMDDTTGIAPIKPTTMPTALV